jgi:hypothetical protein
MTVSQDIPHKWAVSSFVGLISIIVVPPSFCIWLWHTVWESLIAGSLLWLASVIAKRALFLSLNRKASAQSLAISASLQGVFSAVMELGVAALYLAFRQYPSSGNIIAFGVGAGCTEAAYVLGLGLFGPRPSRAVLDAWVSGAEVSICVRYMVPIERLFALFGHTGSRGLIYVGLHSSPPLALGLIAAAGLLFALIDGVAVYGHRRNCNWFDPVLCRRVHLFFSSASLTECILFALALNIDATA